MTISEYDAWTAFDQRDRNFDGRFVVAVTTTRIYCRPSCPARRPKREHVRFLADAAAAHLSGYRACLSVSPMRQRLTKWRSPAHWNSSSKPGGHLV